MIKSNRAAILLAALSLACEGVAQAPATAGSAHGRECTVERVSDGDTIRCSGERVRLLLLDAPEQGQGDPGLRARLALEELIPVGSRVRLELDVEERDQYDRVLAHVRRADGVWVNREMVRRGYALVVVFQPNVRGVEELRAAADSARREGAGRWGADGFDCEPREFKRGEC